jgi:hypothetical protein
LVWWFLIDVVALTGFQASQAREQVALDGALQVALDGAFGGVKVSHLGEEVLRTRTA